jgi:outer membrane protein TolC
LSADIAAQKREAVLGRAVAQNETALLLAQQRYEVGSGDLRGVRQQQLAVYGSRAALVRVQTEQLVQRVNLYLALGGGFEAAPAAAPVAQAKE